MASTHTPNAGARATQPVDVSLLLALENAALAKELSASRARIFAAGAAERRRIERDLHDGAQNRLVALRVKLSLAADRAAEAGADDLHRTLLALGQEAQEALDGVRTIAHGIYPPLLAMRGLGDALAAEADRAPLPVRIAGGVPRSTPEAEAAVYYCCLEAIQNAAKHAGPGASVTVCLRPDGDRIDFAIEDDGAGFDPRAVCAANGLTHVRDRIEAVGGEVMVRAVPGGGTTVSGAAPWLPRDAAG
jgi:signal transduction histidine kinase